MKNNITALVIVMAAFWAGCGVFRGSGYKDRWARDAGYPPGPGLLVRVVDDAPWAGKNGSAPRPPTAGELRNVLFYSDLGPDSIDVSGYPTQQRHNYSIYARTCSRCHSLSRSLHAPTVGRGAWAYYVMSMRVRAFMSRKAWVEPHETQAILDFLEYDSRLRKVEKAAEFQASTDELVRAYDGIVKERMGKLQKGLPPHMEAY